jgi:hypothetical protein
MVQGSLARKCSAAVVGFAYRRWGYAYILKEYVSRTMRSGLQCG